MRSPFFRNSWGLLLLLCWSLTGLTQDLPPSDPLELSEAVFRLEQKLTAQSISGRDAAEKQLIAWGIPVLDHLSPLMDSQAADLQQRLVRIRAELEKQAVVAVTNPSKLQLSGELSLSAILEQVVKQTGNKVSAETLAQEKADQKSTWDGQTNDFWSVMRRLQTIYGLEIDPYSGGESALAVVEGLESSGSKDSKAVFTHAGILDIELNRIDSTRNLKLPETDRTSYGITVRWEPRLRPISIDIPQASLKIVDQFDQVWIDESDSEIHYGMVQPGFLQLDFTLRQALVNRKVEEIKSLSGVAVAVLPGRTESFQFAGIGNVPPDSSQTKGGATVTYDGMLKLDDLFGARIGLSFSEENNALESHQSWAYQNECFLETRDGRRIDSIGSETYQQENTRLGVMFLFPEYPGDAKLVYRTPAAIVKVKIPFELKGIKLP